MENKTISKKGGIVFGLSLGAIFIVPILGFFMAIIRQIFDPESVNPSRTIFSEAGITSCLFSLVFAFLGVFKGINVLKSNKKSVLTRTGIILSTAVIVFWTFFIVGELLYNH